MRWKRISTVVAVSAVLAFGGCATTRTMLSSGGKTGQTWTLSTSPKVPAAAGQVRVAQGDDGNQTIDVKVEHMAPPAKVFDGTSHYVVWLMPEGNAPPQNVGVLPIGEDLTGHLTAKTPFKNFDIVVTAEAVATAARPSGNRVMNATVRLAT
jgi:hypothetical protein